MNDPATSQDLRTPAVAAVLDAVRATGLSAFPKSDGSPADVVFAVAVLRNLNPVELQRQVLAYADGIALHSMGA